jgi:hypothetical protein
LQRRTRNHICIWIIFLGLANFFGYTVVYAQLGGDAKNGGKQRVMTDAGEEVVYYVRGHFIRGTSGQRTDVPRWLWIYSYIHSITLWPTQGVMMISMLILARPHIIATMRESTWIRGPAIIAVAMTLIGVLYSAMTIWFTIHLVSDLRS